MMHNQIAFAFVPTSGASIAIPGISLGANFVPVLREIPGTWRSWFSRSCSKGTSKRTILPIFGPCPEWFTTVLTHIVYGGISELIRTFVGAAYLILGIGIRNKRPSANRTLSLLWRASHIACVTSRRAIRAAFARHCFKDDSTDGASILDTNLETFATAFDRAIDAFVSFCSRLGNRESLSARSANALNSITPRQTKANLGTVFCFACQARRHRKRLMALLAIDRDGHNNLLVGSGMLARGDRPSTRAGLFGWPSLVPGIVYHNEDGL